MNPYDPGIPVPPERFAGRRRLIDRTQDLLEKARQERSNSSLLLHGHRGSGKTSALRKVQALALEKDPRTVHVEVPLRQRHGEAALLSDIADELQRFGEARKSTGSFFQRLHSRLSSVSVSVLGTGVAVAKSTPGRTLNPLSLWKATMTAAAEAPLVVISIDDAELLDDPGIGTLKTIAESNLEVPVLLVVAGGPELRARLSLRGGSPVARIFSGSTFDMSDFTREETEEALAAPLRSRGPRTSWDPAAVQRVQDLSHGYPYLVQCLACAAYHEGTISREDVEAGIEGAVEMAGPWLQHELERASDEDIRAFVRIADSRRSALRTTEILQLGVLPPYVPRLVRLGVLEQVARGHYVLKKAPVIAYYHALRRNLT
ncbi:MAG: AAA family ATPase [Euryarchaeota archaeon]|nr:AAA family ATPase [Euryarchaeota archaeon]